MRLIQKLIFIAFFPIYLTLEVLVALIKAALSRIEKKSTFWKARNGSHRLNESFYRFARKIDRLWQRPAITHRAPVEQIFDKRPEPYRSRDQRRLTDKLPFGKRAVVYYYEPFPNASIRSVIENKMPEIINRMKSRSVDYIDLTALTELRKDTNRAAAQYYLPVGEDLIDTLTESIQNNFSHRQFCEILGIEEPESPCFIKCWPKKHEGKYLYNFYFLPESDVEAIEAAIDYYLHFVSGDFLGIKFSKDHTLIPKPGTDPDDDHEDADRKLDSHLKMMIGKELDQNGVHGLVKMVSYMCVYFKSDSINIPQELRLLADNYVQRTKPSRLLIRSNGSIELLDYGKEVNLSPLQLTVYLFFIQRPDGIMFKELPKYRNELYRIYSILTNRSDLDTISKSIDDLANPFSNSMSEKCSRIKEAFLKIIDERWAEPYYINGGRNEPKRIPLSRELIEIESDI